MSLVRIASLTGAAAIALAAYTGVAHAGQLDSHTMTVRFPDGRVGQITYMGDVPPTIVVAPTTMMPVAMTPAFADPFASMDRVMAAMDRQAAEMFRVMNATMSSPMAVVPASAGPGVCMRSIQVTFTGQGQPHVVQRTAGDCGGGSATPTALPPVPAARPGPRIIEASASMPPRS